MSVLLGAIVLCGCAAAQAPVPDGAARPAYETDAKFVEAMTKGRTYKKQGVYVAAADEFKKAVKASGGKCLQCLEDLYLVQEGMGSFKEAASTAQQMEAVAVTPREKSLAKGWRGNALFQQGGEKPKPEQLEAAHAELQAALTDVPKNLSARWTDACVLARMGKDAEAKEQFAQCAAEAQPSDPMRLRALHFAENPSLSREKMAPAFEVTAMDGKRFNLDAMGGKVVLIDFWATWCGPCNEELPHMKKLAKEFAGEPFVIISISWDKDEDAWRKFVAKHEMTWPQYRDKDSQLAKMFGVNAIPNYFTIDSDGVLTSQMMGSGHDVEGKLRKLIKRAKEARPAAAQVAAN